MLHIHTTVFGLQRLLTIKGVSLTIGLVCFGIFILSTPGISFGAEASRSVSKSFRLSSTGLVSVENKFGKIHVNTTALPQSLTVSVEIKVARSTMKEAEKVIESIQIEFDESSGGVRMVTRLPDKMNSNKQDKLEVHYTINMPASNPLQLKNAFGDSYIGDHTGGQTAHVTYGQLRTGDLKGGSELRVGFGSFTSQFLEQGKLKIEYAQATIEKAGTLEVKDDFSQLTIRDVEYLQLHSKYSKLELGTVHSIEGSVSFSGSFAVELLLRKAKLTLKYVSDCEIRSLGAKAEMLEFNTSFSNVTLSMPKSIPFVLDAEVSYGSVHYPTKYIERSAVDKSGAGQKALIAYRSSTPPLKVIMRGSYGKWVITQSD